MKRLDLLLKTPRLMIIDTAEDGGTAQAQLLSSKKSHFASIQFSWGGGWDHVSVSFSNRCPTWEEMCEVKSMFFDPDETCIQYHPKQEDYINDHKYCLHIWKCQYGVFQTPPWWMVGRKDGVSQSEIMRLAKRYFINQEQTTTRVNMILAALRSPNKADDESYKFAADLIEHLYFNTPLPGFSGESSHG